VIDRLSTQELADLAALADGTLPAERRAEVEARVAESPELLELVARQRQAVTATQMLEDDPVPPSLYETVERSRPRPRARRPAFRLALAGGLAVVVAVVSAIVFSGGVGGPTVADAAQLAISAPTGPAPAAVGGSPGRLDAEVEGVVFPNLARAYGWRPVGVRHGKVDGRTATVVYYARGTRRIAYVIVGGSSLPRPSKGVKTTADGVEYQVLRLNGRLAITWRRGGRTCVLIGDASPVELLALASWPVSSGR
jgi:anti-sigma factor RsiW